MKGVVIRILSGPNGGLYTSSGNLVKMFARCHGDHLEARLRMTLSVNADMDLDAHGTLDRTQPPRDNDLYSLDLKDNSINRYKYTNQENNR